jgi:pimeloyl-ACP methyl ester carboxylesterase
MTVRILIWLSGILAATSGLPVLSQNSMLMAAPKMQYKIAGEGPPLVLLPGGLTGWVSWDSYVPQFAARHRVLQFQLLAVEWGLENKPLPARYSVRMESEALAASLNEADIDTPGDFVGWSFGAFVLLDFALNHPQRVRSLTLIEPPAFWILKAQNQLSPDADRTMRMLQSLQGDISEDQLETFMTSVGFAPPGTSLKNHPNWATWVIYRQSLRNSPQVVEHTDALKRLNTFQVPVLLVKGTNSAPFLHEIIQILQQELPRAQTVELAAGHAPHLVSREEFLKILSEFHQQR